MTNKPKNIGTATESAVVKLAKAHGFTNAKRLALAGALDKGDVSLGDDIPITIEVKGGHAAENASDGVIGMWVQESHREMEANGHLIAALVSKRKGKGFHNAGAWFVHMDTLCYLRLLNARAGGAGGTTMVTMSLESFIALCHIYCTRNRIKIGDPE